MQKGYTLFEIPSSSTLLTLSISVVFSLKDALSKFQEITNNLEFARELQKSFLTLGQDVSSVISVITHPQNHRSTLVNAFVSRHLNHQSLPLLPCPPTSSLADPEGGEEVCAAGAAAARGDGAAEAEDGAGAAVPAGPAGGRHGEAGPEEGRRLGQPPAQRGRPHGPGPLLQAGGA